MFDIDIDSDEIADLNDKDAFHLKDGLPDDKNTDIEDNEVQHKQNDRHNRFCTLVENEL